MSARIHTTAIVHPEAKIHDSCEIGPFCIVEKGAQMGPGNRLMSHVVIQNRTTIGENNTFHPFSVIGGTPQDLKYEGESTEVIIGDDNDIRESVTINIGTKGGGGITRVGNKNLLMAYCHLGHDTQVANHTVIANAVQIAGHVTVEDYAIIGGSSAIGQFIRIGAHSYIGGCSGVDRDVAPYVFGRGPTGGFEVLGFNIVGLKRRGFSAEVVSALQDVSKIFKDKSLEKETALQKIEQSFGSYPEVQRFVTFVRGSQKGIFR